MGAFLRYDKIRLINYYLFDHTNNDNGLPSGTAMRLSGGLNEKEGLAKSISVMPGDKITMEVYAKYVDPAADANNFGNALKTILGYLAAPLTAPTGTIIDGAGYSTSTETFPSLFLGLLDKSEDAGGPKAYLNWLIFDHDFNFKDGGFVQMNNTGKEDGTDVAHQLLTDSIEIEEAGFVYIYLSNEEETPVEVYFDDFKVTQVKSPVIASNDYYPFGLTFNSYARENSTPNQYKFNGKEEQDELGLDWLDYGARMYDPATARWSSVDPLAEVMRRYSPYNYCFDNPIRYIDPDGMEADNYYGHSDALEKFGFSSKESFSNVEQQSNQTPTNKTSNDFSKKMGDWADKFEKKNDKIFGDPTQDGPEPNGPCPPGVDCAAVARAAKDGGIFLNYFEGASNGVQFSMLKYRQSLSIGSKLGTFRAFSGSYKAIGLGSKMLGGIGTYVITPLSIGMDLHDASLPEYDPDHISVPRAGFRIIGSVSSVGAGALSGTVLGGPAGFVIGSGVGAGFSAAEMSYDGIIWYGDKVSEAVSQFNAACRNGWVPGRR